jgi:hypothetical protein
MKNIQFKGIGHPQHGFGLIPDPPGHRYNGFHLHPAAQLRAAALPSASSNLRFAPDVWNQGQTGSCFGHGMAGQITTTIAAHGKPLPSPVRPRVVYAFTRAIDRVDPSVPLQDSGSQPNSGVRALSLWGCVLEGDDDGGRTATSPDYTASEKSSRDKPAASLASTPSLIAIAKRASSTDKLWPPATPSVSVSMLAEMPSKAMTYRRVHSTSPDPHPITGSSSSTTQQPCLFAKPALCPPLGRKSPTLPSCFSSKTRGERDSGPRPGEPGSRRTS